MTDKHIRSALVSVYHKEGLDDIIKWLSELGVTLYSTGGTQKYIEELGVAVEAVEELTSFPSILGGRVKTLHPKVFGGILAKRDASHLSELGDYEIPEIDLVIVDLYPFEKTVAGSAHEDEIIEKIDIGGVSLIRAAAKNFRDVLVVGSSEQYPDLYTLLTTKHGWSDEADRKAFAKEAFKVSSHYDTAIYTYFSEDDADAFKLSMHDRTSLRYGENPHQIAAYYGDLSAVFQVHGGKELSYNNLVDIDAAFQLMRDMPADRPVFLILKHTNACGVAVRDTLLEAWQTTLACDPVSAFGGILMTNWHLDVATARSVDEIFYEVLIAPSYDPEALEILRKKKNRIILSSKSVDAPQRMYKSLLNGVIVQDVDTRKESPEDLKIVTEVQPAGHQLADLLFGLACVKHLKSNAIVLARSGQLIGMGCGQTSRVDALKQAVAKAKAMGFDLSGAVMASDAFFPFADCVEIAHSEGITAVAQPGGSVRDQDSIDYCDRHGMSMVMTGIRHFRH